MIRLPPRSTLFPYPTLFRSIVALCGAILAIHLIGGLYPNPIAVLFTNPDGSPCQMPCLFGVRPSVMTLDEGLKILDQHPLTQAMETYSSERSELHNSAVASLQHAVCQHLIVIG